MVQKNFPKKKPKPKFKGKYVPQQPVVMRVRLPRGKKLLGKLMLG